MIATDRFLPVSSDLRGHPMPVRPPIHRPVGRRDKREADRDANHKRDAAVRALYKSARWQRARQMFLARHPLCAECQRQGRVSAANTVDHIIPHQGDQTLFWDESNWQSLCKLHHDRDKAEQEGRHAARTKFDADGRVVW